MKIKLLNTGKKFNHKWIFKNVNTVFTEGKIYGITGSNGSGKSTFLKLLSAFYTPSKGKIIFERNGNKIENESIYEFLLYTAPYISLHEELSFTETLQFHSHFKLPLQNLNISDIIEISTLSEHKNKAIKDFSSGMQQRVKLCLSLLFDSPILLLDEPCSHLDKNSYQWFFQLLEKYSENRLVIIASNEEEELKMCTETFCIEKYKS